MRALSRVLSIIVGVSHPIIAMTILATANVQADDAKTPAAAEASPSPAKADPRAQPLDLKPYYHTAASKFEKDNGYPWRDVPKGSQTFGSIPLEIGGRICLWGGANARGGLVFPEKLVDIKVERLFEALYLYHATFHSAPDGTSYLMVVFQYEDGSTAETDLSYGTNARDWYQSPNGPEELGDDKSKMVWSGINSMSPADPQTKLQFFITEIVNPLPDIKVKSIDLVSLKQRPAPCVMAMTTGPAGLLTDEIDTKKESADK